MRGDNVAIIKAKGLAKHYHGVTALHGVDLEVQRGEIQAIIGPNGAGKSTLFSLISGESFPTSGSIEYKRNFIHRLPAWKRTRLGIGRCFQVAKVFSRMTTLENVLVAAQAKSSWRGDARWGKGFVRPLIRETEEAGRILEEVGLALKADVLVNTLSHGEKKHLELAMALVQEPELLLLDEPTAGMSPDDTMATVELIRRLHQRRGVTVLLTEHDMEVVFGLADKITVLHRGKVIATGKPEEIRSDPVVQEVYMGKEGEFDVTGEPSGSLLQE